MPGQPCLPLQAAPSLRFSPRHHNHAFIPTCRRAFHASARFLDSNGTLSNHYERLNVRHDASTAEIKKSFYSLSRKHHPDINRDDPNAADTFSKLSEAYKTLSDPARRATYDRDVLRLHQQHHAVHGVHRGSYHSTNPAGGRPPSGLSRRRGTFRGPPPSFYRSGGWGDQTEKRQKAHQESTGTNSSPSGAKSSANSSSNSSSSWENVWHAYNRYGSAAGANPYSKWDEVPHFDSAGHTRTHRRQDERRWERQRRAVDDDNVEFEPQMSLGGHFLMVAAILSATLIMPVVYLQFSRFSRRKKEVD
ncbi:hypothetical protein B0I35DRAFT_127773 [Stachybotrys elegans]|uniref:J domain-containing protein n=1 Tax=Stachybotrys elegans TaxID=80388 RepID=A0A8K0WV11_9HYPO|nr:hypothetical protein B0I35DRAFT_127773 [Stachybotrys elegans]